MNERRGRRWVACTAAVLALVGGSCSGDDVGPGVVGSATTTVIAEAPVASAVAMATTTAPSTTSAPPRVPPPVELIGRWELTSTRLAPLLVVVPLRRPVVDVSADGTVVIETQCGIVSTTVTTVAPLLAVAPLSQAAEPCSRSSAVDGLLGVLAAGVRYEVRGRVLLLESDRPDLPQPLPIALVRPAESPASLSAPEPNLVDSYPRGLCRDTRVPVVPATLPLGLSVADVRHDNTDGVDVVYRWGTPSVAMIDLRWPGSAIDEAAETDVTHRQVGGYDATVVRRDSEPSPSVTVEIVVRWVGDAVELLGLAPALIDRCRRVQVAVVAPSLETAESVAEEVIESLVPDPQSIAAIAPELDPVPPHERTEATMCALRSLLGNDEYATRGRNSLDFPLFDLVENLPDDLVPLAEAMAREMVGGGSGVGTFDWWPGPNGRRILEALNARCPPEPMTPDPDGPDPTDPDPVEPAGAPDPPR